MTKEELLTKKLEEFAQIIPDASPDGFTMPHSNYLRLIDFGMRKFSLIFQ